MSSVRKSKNIGQRRHTLAEVDHFEAPKPKFGRQVNDMDLDEIFGSCIPSPKSIKSSSRMTNATAASTAKASMRKI